MAPARSSIKWKRLLSSVDRKRKVNMNKRSPDYRIEAMLVSTVKKRKPKIQLPEERTSHESYKARDLPVTYVYVNANNGNCVRDDSQEYSWGSSNGDWNLKRQESEDFLNLNSFFNEVRSPPPVDR